MEIRQVSAIHGWYWITQGFQMFRKAPMVWMLICFIPFLIAVTISLMMPMAGPVIFLLSAPIFLAGVMVACREQEQGRQIEVSHLFIGFKTHLAPLVTVGIIFLLGLVTIYSLFLSTGGGDLIAMLEDGKRYDSSEIGEISSGILSSFLMVIVLQIPLLMAVVFSPVLIILHNFSPLNAMKKSFLACIRNIIPFFVYNLILNMLSVIVLLLPYIGLVILSPVIFASIYVSYKEILLGEPVKMLEEAYPQVDYQKANWANTDDEQAKQDQDQEQEQEPSSVTAKTSAPAPEERPKRTPPAESSSEMPEGDIIHCYQCEILIPKEEAIRFDGKYFCSSEHFQEYQDSMTAKPRNEQNN